MTKSEQRSGYTLIELLVVVAMIGLISFFALPNVTSYFKLSLNSATRELASTIKETYNSAVMTGKVHRLVYDIQNKQYWVEVGPPGLLLHTEESLELDEERNRFKNEDEKTPPPSFMLDKSITRKKQDLPRGVEFEDVITEQNHEPITSGVAYTHFFPHGLAEQTLIHLKDGSEHKISLVISPVVGRTVLLNGYSEKEEVFGDE